MRYGGKETGKKESTEIFSNEEGSDPCTDSTS
jgi:hypothetical protein